MAAIYRTRRSYPRGVRGKLVLVIDDDRDIQKLLRTALEQKDYEIALVDNAEDGVALAKDIQVDLVITDIFMRGQGGLWAIQQIKAMNADLKVIALSGGWHGIEGGDVIRAAQKAGADIGMSKPFNIADLHAHVNELVGPAIEINI